MSFKSKYAVFSAACGLTLFYASAAQAQATRTWVSGVGDDANPCSRTAPCKTFAGAISKTATNGEINCLDPGGFGAVTITKSITINCVYTEGGVLASGNGIVVNDCSTATPGTAVVVLRGLDIYGVSPSTHGVRIISGAAVHIEESAIRRFNSSGSFGVSFQPSRAMQLHIRNTNISENGSGATGGGILIQPTGGTGSASVHLDNVSLRNNANNNLRVDTNGSSSAGISVAISNSHFIRSGVGIDSVDPTGTIPLSIVVVGSSIVGNTSVGIQSSGPASVVRVSDSLITGNTIGLQQPNSGVIFSYGTNILDANPNNAAPNNGVFSGVVQPRR